MASMNDQVDLVENKDQLMIKDHNFADKNGTEAEDHQS